MQWLRESFGVDKPVIAMLHLKPLPGDPQYDAVAGMDAVLEAAAGDLAALQAGGVDAVMFSNEFSLPYLTSTEPITAISMARIIGELRSDVAVPFGVNVLWDGLATIDLAAATGAGFVREIFSGVYASDFGLWNTDVGAVARRRRHHEAMGVRLLFNIVPEAARYLADRDVKSITRTTIFNCAPDGLCVSGATAGASTDTDQLRAVKSVAGRTPVFANTGVRVDTLATQFSVADGAIVGTAFKRDGVFENEVDVNRVTEFMTEARRVREPVSA
jgi:membrane complex biogenesis BtpA family protein